MSPRPAWTFSIHRPRVGGRAPGAADVDGLAHRRRVPRGAAGGARAVERTWPWAPVAASARAAAAAVAVPWRACHRVSPPPFASLFLRATGGLRGGVHARVGAGVFFAARHGCPLPPLAIPPPLRCVVGRHRVDAPAPAPPAVRAPRACAAEARARGTCAPPAPPPRRDAAGERPAVPRWPPGPAPEGRIAPRASRHPARTRVGAPAVPVPERCVRARWRGAGVGAVPRRPGPRRRVRPRARAPPGRWSPPPPRATPRAVRPEPACATPCRAPPPPRAVLPRCPRPTALPAPPARHLQSLAWVGGGRARAPRARAARGLTPIRAGPRGPPPRPAAAAAATRTVGPPVLAARRPPVGTRDAPRPRLRAAPPATHVGDVRKLISAAAPAQLPRIVEVGVRCVRVRRRGAAHVDRYQDLGAASTPSRPPTAGRRGISFSDGAPRWFFFPL